MLEWTVTDALPPPARTPRTHPDPPAVLVAHPSADLYGADRMLLESVTGMVARGWRVVVTVPGPGPLVAELERLGVRVAYCPAPVVRKSALRPRGLLALAWAAVTGIPAGLRLAHSLQADVVYVNTVTVPLWLVVARLLRRPAVCHVHEAETSAPRPARLALTLPLLLATRVIANSRFTLGVLTGAVARLRPRTVVVHNGVPARPAPAPRAALDAPLRLLYVGRLSARKGVDVAVAATRILAARGVDVRLDVVGAPVPGAEWFEHELRASAGSPELDGRVAFHGYDPDPWSNAAAADVVLVPSRLEESFGNTAVEAGLAARPVVVSDTSGLREAASGLGSAVLVPPGDAVAVADAVAAIAADWPRYRSLAVEGAPALADRHDVGRYRREVCDVVGAVLPASRVGGVPAATAREGAA
jgi:glycosyltransferase involved in cell wall biosynthesis